MPAVQGDRADESISRDGHNHAGHHEGDGSGDETSSEAFWDQRYQSNSALWSGHVNSHLVTEASDLSAGSALDVGCGEGADAIWLARRGWRVTAVDISAVALGRGSAHALEISAEVGERISWLHADLTEWVPPAASYDLVSAQFMHLKNQREVVTRRLAASVAPGGTLLVVGHHPSDLQTTVPRPSVPGLLFTASEVAESLPAEQWVILVEESRARQTLDPDGRAATVHDAVLRATRVSS